MDYEKLAKAIGITILSFVAILGLIIIVFKFPTPFFVAIVVVILAGYVMSVYDML